MQAKDITGKTPIHYTLKNNNYKELIKFIIAGANPLYFGQKKLVETGLECNRVLQVFKNFWLKLIFYPDAQRWKIFHQKKKEVIQNCHYEIEKYKRVQTLKKKRRNFDDDLNGSKDSILAMIKD